MALGAEGVVKALHGLDGIVHVLQLIHQLPGGQGLADVHHRAPDHHHRRHHQDGLHHQLIDLVAGSQERTGNDGQHQADLQAVDDDGVDRGLLYADVMPAFFQQLHFFPSLTW